MLGVRAGPDWSKVKAERTRAWPAGAHNRRVDEPLAAWAAFRRARDGSAGYRDLLAAAGRLDPAAWDEVPYLDKHIVFGSPDWPRWVLDPGIAGAAELVTSSGQSGVFSLGVADAAERAGLAARVDGLLAGLGARPGSPSLLINCLPMGIAVPTGLATVITPSTHLEMALEALLVLAPHFKRVVLLGEPLFVKELAERRRELVGPAGLGRPLFVMTGGEFLAESLRADLCHLLGIFGPADGGVICSMGAAELGLHMLFETPELIAARVTLAADPVARSELLGADPGYAPSLLGWDPGRFHLEERLHPDGARSLVATTLEPVALPLIRYDLGDLVRFLPPASLAALVGSEARAWEMPGVVALLGRPVAVEGRGWRLSPEQVKERLFADPALARATSGRFHIASEGAAHLHLECRGQLRPEPATLAALTAWLERRSAPGATVTVHPAGAYPYHPAGDWQHKPRYAGALGWGRDHEGAGE